jgi:hypothetical protein
MSAALQIARFLVAVGSLAGSARLKDYSDKGFHLTDVG